jgi:UDP-glucose 4-epimerase
LLAASNTEAVTVYDNFSSGREWHVEHHSRDARFTVVRGDVASLKDLLSAIKGHDVVIHLASNPDIARAVTDPAIDFDQGTRLTHNVVEAMRLSGSARRILYASGSGVYGDLGDQDADEELGPFHPVSTYGASKLAGEALIRAYCCMFGLTGCAFRFGNVVGPRQTHGVGYDFLRRLRKNNLELRILGDGRQSKSYVYVEDVVAAVMLAHKEAPLPFAAYNIATGDYITVTEIANLAVECAGLDPGRVRFEFTGGSRGWKGDVPVVRLSTARIRGLGWVRKYGSRDALRASMEQMNGDERVVG